MNGASQNALVGVDLLLRPRSAYVSRWAGGDLANQFLRLLCVQLARMSASVVPLETFQCCSTGRTLHSQAQHLL